MNKTDLYYDFFDQIAMLLVEHKKLNYLEAFYETTKILCDEGYDCKVDQEVVESMEEILKAFFSEVFSQEDIRLALELLTIKAFKDTNQSLDFMTPDSVNYILSRVINRKFYQNDLKILDLNLGTSNLLQAIANNFPNETELFGIESNKDVVQLASAWADLQNNEIKIYLQDAIYPIFDLVDVQISDLDCYEYEKDLPSMHPLKNTNITYFPYLAILGKLDNLKDQGYFFYVINNDFFTNSQFPMFQTYIKEFATLVGLIVLPESMFRQEKQQKSILIGKKSIMVSHHLMLFPIKSLMKEQLPELFAKLDQFTDKL